MPYTLEDYRREVMRENWAEMSLEERSALLKDLPPGERLQLLKGISIEERSALLKDLPPGERLQLLKDISFGERSALLRDLAPEERAAILKDLPLEERLQGLSEDQLEAYLRALRAKSDANGENATEKD